MECNFDAAIPGAIYGREMYEVGQSGRVRPCYDRKLKTYAAIDLGWSDDTAIWWFQVAGKELRFIDCYSNSGMPIAHYHDILQSKGYDYGEWLYLPHDAKAKSLQTGRSIEEQFRSLGWSPRIVPNISLMDGIQAARLSLANCWFDPSCKEGMEALTQYQREYNADKKVFNERPKHDWTSHFADAFRYACLAWREQRPDAAPKPKAKFWEDQSLEELWEHSSKRRGRRI
jgi:phage terminase large subunit